MKKITNLTVLRSGICLLGLLLLLHLNGQAQYLSVDLNGNVGIGTNTPSTKLEVKGSASANNPVLQIRPYDWSGTGDIGELRFGDTNHYIRGEYNGGMKFYDLNSFTFSGGPMTIQNIPQDETFTRMLTTDSNGNIRYRNVSSLSNWTLTSGSVYRSSGKVGIGVSSISDSDTKLQVWGGDIRIENDEYLKSNGVLNIQADDDNSGDGIIKFHAGNDTRMTLLDNGNLGVGSTNPAAKLEVASGEVKIPGGSGSSNSFPTHFNLGGDGANYIRGNTYIADDGGNVGVGTSSPTEKLHVNGHMRADTVHTYATLSLSDKRFKRGIQTISGSMNMLNQISGKTYQFKQNQSFQEYGLPKGKQFGFLAQNVRDILPELVHERRDGYLAVNYTGFIPVLVEALKEQNALVQELTQKVNELERQVSVANGSANGLPADTEVVLPLGQLYQNAPNPFTTSTQIRYELPEEARNAQLIIYDLQGNQLRAFNDLNAGKGQVELQGASLKAGMYIYSLITNDQIVDTKRMILTN